MKDDQLTLRLPRELARRIRQQARERGVPRSSVVRAAIEAYLGSPPLGDPAELWSRVAPMAGSLTLDRAASERDAIARQVRAHNWRP